MILTSGSTKSRNNDLTNKKSHLTVQSATSISLFQNSRNQRANVQSMAEFSDTNSSYGDLARLVYRIGENEGWNSK